MKRILTVIVLAALFIGCSSDDKDNNLNFELSDLVGVWHTTPIKGNLWDIEYITITEDGKYYRSFEVLNENGSAECYRGYHMANEYRKLNKGDADTNFNVELLDFRDFTCDSIPKYPEHVGGVSYLEYKPKENIIISVNEKVFTRK